MQRATPIACLMVATLVAPTSAWAALCSQDRVPAASLLLPYFEVSGICIPGAGRNVRFTVTNTEKAAVLTRVTLWSNVGVAALEYDVYLNGFDQQTIDLADVVCNGNLPETGAGVPPGPGRLAATTTTYPGCNATSSPAGGAPVYGAGALSPTQRAELVAALSGNPLPSAPTQCSSLPNGRSTLEGYITIDAVNRCGADSLGEANFGAHLDSRNVLVGSAVLIDDVENASVAIPAIALEATTTSALDASPSFYGLGGSSVGPRREPLPNAWSVELVQNAATRTDYIVWRAPPGPGAPFLCSSGPAWHPLQLDTKAGFGSRGYFHVTDAGTAVRPLQIAPVGRATQRVGADSLAELAAFTGAGFTYFNLFQTTVGATLPAQAWAGSVIVREGRFQSMEEGAPQDAACAAPAFDNTSTGPVTSRAGD